MYVDSELTRPQLSNDHINNKSFQITEPNKRCANTNFWPNCNGKTSTTPRAFGATKTRRAHNHTQTQTHAHKQFKSENQVYDLRGMVVNPVWMAPINYSIGNSAITQILSFKHRTRLHDILPIYK